MNIKAALKYRLYDSKNYILMYYAITFCVIILLFVGSLTGYFGGSAEGMEVASAIFLLVFGLNSFKETFRLFIQNSISRKTMFVCHLLLTIIISAFIATIDSLIMLLCKGLIATNTIEIHGIFELIYNRQISSIGTFALSFMFCFCINIAFISLGYFITTLYYKMNKGQKIAVSVGVPALLYLFMPILDMLYFKGAIFNSIGRFFLFAFGTPLKGVLSSIIAAIILYSLSWLLIRKSSIKN